MKSFLKNSVLVSAVLCLVVIMAAVAAPNFVRDAGTVAYVNGGADIVSGEVIDVGSRYGIAGADIASNVTGTVFTKGVWGLTLRTNETVTLDAKLYWVAESTSVTATATSGKFIGLAAEAVTTTSNTTALIAVDLNAVARGAIVTAVTGVSKQTVSLTDTNGVTALAVTNVSATTTSVGY